MPKEQQIDIYQMVQPITLEFQDRDIFIRMVPETGQQIQDQIVAALGRAMTTKPKLRNKNFAIYRIVEVRGIQLGYEYVIHAYIRGTGKPGTFWGICHYRDGKIFPGDEISKERLLQ